MTTESNERALQRSLADAHEQIIYLRRNGEYLQSCIDEQKNIIQELNSIIGGAGSLTTENITCIAGLETELTELRQQADAAIEQLKSYEQLFKDATIAIIKERDTLLASYKEAVEDIEDWGVYASEYFKEKHGLTLCVENHRKIIASIESQT